MSPIGLEKILNPIFQDTLSIWPTPSTKRIQDFIFRLIYFQFDSDLPVVKRSKMQYSLVLLDRGFRNAFPNTPNVQQPDYYIVFT